jgi:hypothetical protein
LTAIAGFGAVAISVITQRWNQRRAAIDLVNRWNDDALSQANNQVRELIPLATRAAISMPDLEERFKSTPELKNSIYVVLGHLEIVAMCASKGVIDDDLGQHLYGHIVVDYYCGLQPFIEQLRGHKYNAHPRKKPLHYLIIVAHKWGHLAPDSLWPIPPAARAM